MESLTIYGKFESSWKSLKVYGKFESFSKGFLKFFQVGKLYERYKVFLSVDPCLLITVPRAFGLKDFSGLFIPPVGRERGTRI